MLIEQETASIAKYMLSAAGNVKPYYHEVPEGFWVPSIYFPIPEVEGSGGTLSTYANDFVWYPKVFHSSTEGAYEIGMEILTAIQEHRNLIPLLDADGQPAGYGVRIKDPKLRRVDSGVVQIEISWQRERSYYEEAAAKITGVAVNFS